MLMQEQSKSSTDCRFGFQGQELDNEIKGKGNSINYKYRMHCLSREERIGNPRVGRFFAVDPLAPKYPYYSPYSFSGNRVIDMVELEGLEPAKPRRNHKPNKRGFSGVGFLGKLFGKTSRGKYFKKNLWRSRKRSSGTSRNQSINQQVPAPPQRQPQLPIPTLQPRPVQPISVQSPVLQPVPVQRPVLNNNPVSNNSVLPVTTPSSTKI